ncbi:FAD-dependent monooxygenase [Paenarthrobacter sp. Z7-10]|uniref:FAD-dependent oxidoreductase n=1 Tax=Paenarthrobacter sp. Z7-10 TaxID=2787635 RepID=UPI0022A9EF19|nr:NAD(P)/FAD-dependent oxidoreductase [Paenarthrobacter sp. Z7-10]MCZ2404363.1 FAD-dependent monooxygenase [Paenarthrobacter sp. Z7-10]
MHDVVIVGGGPVGLYLAALLLQKGLDVRVLEQRTVRSGHSRAIGIHPPALAALEAVDAAEPLLREGVRICEGLARSGGSTVAGLSFARTSATHPYVLSVPQLRTESILARRVYELDPSALRYGERVLDVHDDGDRVRLCANVDGSRREYTARLVVAADGARSTVRDRLGIDATLRNYPDTYLMGDFRDTTSDGPTAVLYLEPGGIVESFPLPGGVRRWVVHTDALLADPSAELLAALIRRRTKVEVPPESNTMLSAFSVRARLARRLVTGRVALIGDAGHEISPIGGQGMSLGWLDAAALAPILTAAVGGHPTAEALRHFDLSRRRAALIAVRQAHLNMVLGRPLAGPVLAARNRMAGLALGSAHLQDLVARRFTMQ